MVLNKEGAKTLLRSSSVKLVFLFLMFFAHFAQWDSEGSMYSETDVHRLQGSLVITPFGGEWSRLEIAVGKFEGFPLEQIVHEVWVVVFFSWPLLLEVNIQTLLRRIESFPNFTKLPACNFPAFCNWWKSLLRKGKRLKSLNPVFFPAKITMLQIRYELQVKDIKAFP